MSRNTIRPCYISLKGLIAAAFESSEQSYLLRVNGRVGAIPVHRESTDSLILT